MKMNGLSTSIELRTFYVLASCDSGRWPSRGAAPPLFWFSTATAEASAFVVVLRAFGDTAGDDADEAAAAAAAVPLTEDGEGKCPEAALSTLGCAKRTPWYITELISSDTTNELSPESPGMKSKGDNEYQW